jgi:hypothetical protein
LAHYRKLFVAVVGLAALLIPDLVGLEDELTDVYDSVVTALTAFGVFRVPNDPPA